jgi:hypothetical protein
MPYLVTADAALFLHRNELAARARGVKRVAIPISPQKEVCRESGWRRNAGSATLRSGAPAAKVVSVYSNAAAEQRFDMRYTRSIDAVQRVETDFTWTAVAKKIGVVLSDSFGM